VDFRVWSYAGLFADTVAGFISWSLGCHLPPTLFFIPLVKMAYTGWEVFMFTWIVAGLLGRGRIMKFVSNNIWLFRLLSLIGYLSQWVEDNGLRIGVTAIGVQMDVLATFGLWLTASEERKNRSITGFVLGFLTFVTVRMWFFSIDPSWLTRKGTYTTLAFGLLCAVIQFFENVDLNTSKKEEEPKTPKSWVRAMLSIGGLFFTTHHLFSEHGLLGRWTEIDPFPSGVLVITALAIGFSLSNQEFVQKPSWAGFGLLGALLFSAGQGKVFPFVIELFGGLMMAVYLFSTWFHVINYVIQAGNYGKVLGIGLFIYPFLQLWGVYVVAFKFMDPILGTLLGERSVLLIVTGVVFTALGHVSFGRKKSSGTARPPNAKKSFKQGPLRAEGQTALLFFFALILLPTALYRVERRNQLPANPNPTYIRTLMWAIHFGYDNFGWISADAMTKVIKDSGANVIGLVETDCSRSFLGNRDFIEYLSEELHFYSDFGPSTAQNTWGCGLLSQFPIVRSSRIVLPSPHGELACLIDADLMVNDTIVNVFVTHFGNTEDELDLKLQTQSLSDLVAKHVDKFSPTILIGYLTTEPFAPNHAKIISSGLRDTTPSLDRYCLYGMYRDLEFESFVRIDKGDVSDTEAQVSTFTLRNQNRDVTPKQSCELYLNDNVGCQAEPSCGWCQMSTVGTCHQAHQRDSCVGVQGVWVGPKPTKSISTSDRQQFLSEAQKEQSETGILTTSNDEITWKMKNFNENYQLHSFYSSPLFKSKGGIWRIKAVFGKRGPYLERPVGFEVELLSTEDDFLAGKSTFDKNQDIRVNFDLKVLDRTGNRAMKRSFNGIVNPQNRVIGDTQLLKYRDLGEFGYVFYDTLTVSVKISELKA